MSSDPKNQDDIIMGEELDLSPEELEISREAFDSLRHDPMFRDPWGRSKEEVLAAYIARQKRKQRRRR